ncbi:MAG: hypothetical protein WDZ64_01695 [Parcubacteria group bacterium]
MTVTTNMPFHIGHQYRVYLFWSLVTVATMSLSIYIYAVNTTAKNIAVRQNLERQASEIATELGTMEFTYIDLKNNVTIEIASLHGFKEEKNPLYISRHLSNSLSLNTSNR